MNEREKVQLAMALEHYSDAKPRVFVKLRNVNEVRDQNYVYRVIAGDLAMVLYAIAEYPTEDDALATVRITKEYVEGWAWLMDLEANHSLFFNNAVWNTATLFHPVFAFIDKQNTSIKRLEMYDPRVKNELTSGLDMIVVTSHTGFNGAALVLVPGVLDRACEVLDCDAIFVGVIDQNAAVVHSVESVTPDAVAESMAFADDTCGPATVSRQVFRYDRRDRFFSTADDTSQGMSLA